VDNFLESFSDELTKIAEKTYSAPVIAHEYGHAKDLETANRKTRNILDILGRTGAIFGSLSGAVRDNPVLGAAAPLIGHIPHLYGEGKASIHAMQALKDLGEHTPEEIDAAKRMLIKAFMSHASEPAALALAGAVGGVLPSGHNKFVGMAAGYALPKLVNSNIILKKLEKDINEGPGITEEGIDRLKAVMKLKNAIKTYDMTKKTKNEGIELKPIHSMMFYPDEPGKPPEEGSVKSKVQKAILNEFLDKEKDVGEVQRHGGVLSVPMKYLTHFFGG
jgi:hypothetical protein